MADRLSAFGFATAHVAVLTVVGILGLHYSSSLGSALEPVGTVVGSLLFGLLWAVAIVTHRRGFESVDPWSVDDRRSAARFVGAGTVWGGLTGAVVFWSVAAGGVLAGLAADPARAADLLSVPTGLLALLGTGTALVIGGAVGTVAAIVDLGAIGAAERIDRR